MVTVVSITDKYQQSQVLFECLDLDLHFGVILIVVAFLLLKQDAPGQLANLILLSAAPLLGLAPV
jgi:hypothetical protein